MKLYRLFFALVLLSLVMSCKNTQNPTNKDNNPSNREGKYSATDSFSLEKTPCFGRCPVYVCTIHGDGKASFLGKKHVPFEGSFSAQLPIDSVSAYFDALKAMPFAEFNETYLAPISDLPRHIVTYKGKTVTGHTRELPQALNELIERVDKLILEQTKWKSDIKE